MERRYFLFLSALLARNGRPENSQGQAGTQADAAYVESARRYLAGLVRTRQEVDDWLAGRAFPFSKYDPELGYLHRDRRFKEGIDDTICTYTYDPSGARHTIAFAGSPCRLNTYGNSFTSCEQVSDGETWQEVLAAFLGEPVRNYGIGGYSVYLAYLRMKREEARNPARYIILNIFDDDHFRNLISYQAITNGKNWKHFQPPLPHVEVDPAAGRFKEMKNPCPDAASLYNLCNADWVYKTFEDDFVLKIRLARQAKGLPDFQGARVVQELASQQGITTQVNYSGDDLVKTANTLYTRAAIFATTRIVELVEQFASANGKKVLYVLSYGPDNVSKRLQGEQRFDQSFVDFLEARKLPYVDLLEAHAADYAQFKSTVKEYLSRYYVGHYNPQGNTFCAFAIRNKLVEMLDPKPAPYGGPYQSGTTA
jgi:hypothetical protein